MLALGVTLVEHGDDFQAASEHAALLAERDGLHRVPSFARELVRGVATCWVEFFEALPKGGTGKILKKELREKYWEGYEKRVH